MKLWLLHGTGKDHKEVGWHEYAPIGDYDTNFGFVIAAETEEQARNIAAQEAGRELADAWLNPERSVCQELIAPEEPQIILRDFHEP
jgi:hypothetical protein